MSTTEEQTEQRGKEGTAPGERRAAPAREFGPFASWRSSWGLALRMARRDVRRHKGRSLVVTLMIGIPTALLVFALTLGATTTITGDEIIPYAFGSAQAQIHNPQPMVLKQNGSDWANMGSDGPAAPTVRTIPGYVPGAGARANAAAMSTFLGGTAVPWTLSDLQVQLGDRLVRVATVVTDASVGLGEKASLISGRWPGGPNEVVVTPVGSHQGLPTDGTIDIRDGRETKTVTVVGRAEVFPGRYGAIGVLSLEPLTTTTAQQESGSWLLLRDTPVTWADVQTWSEYGLPVTSAELTRNPVPVEQLPEELRENVTFANNELRTALVLGTVLLILITTLLVGPAFAVGAARQRRTLALAASNGATTKQLRRTVLGHAVVAGGLAAAIGAAVGIGAAAVVAAWLGRASPDVTVGPFDIMWLWVIGVAACALASAVIAALVPARRLGRLDIIGVMKGQNVSPPISKVLPVIGTVLIVVSGLGLLWGVKTMQSEFVITPAVVGFVLGALFLVPLALVAVARIAGHLPVGLRMATRDVARQRARSAPAVAAIVGGIAALTAILIAVTSDTEQSRLDYTPQNIAGQGMMWLPGGDPNTANVVEAATAAIHKIDPSLVVTRADTLDSMFGQPMEGGAPGEAEPTSWVNVVPPGCTPERTVRDPAFLKAAEDFAATQNVLPPEEQDWSAQPRPTCDLLGTTVTYGREGGSGILVMPADEIVARLGLTGADAEAIRAGGLAVRGPGVVHDGRVTIAHGTMTFDESNGESSDITVTDSMTVPAVELPHNLDSLSRFTETYGGLLPSEQAARAGLETSPTTLLVRDPAGPIDQETEEQLRSVLIDGYFSVERGFESPTALFTAILIGIFGFLLLVVTLTSTALSLAEQRVEDSTLAAVGATRGTRRVMAAGQSLAVCGIGAALGLLVGLVPGIAMTFPLTAGRNDPLSGGGVGIGPGLGFGDPVLVIPWIPLLIGAVGVPLLAALVSAVAVRREPQVTRRLT